MPTLKQATGGTHLAVGPAEVGDQLRRMQIALTKMWYRKGGFFSKKIFFSDFLKNSCLGVEFVPQTYEKNQFFEKLELRKPIGVLCRYGMKPLVVLVWP